MNILVIGNGFDLAHGLRTQYKQFLEFITYFEYYYKGYKNIANDTPYGIKNDNGEENHYKKFYKEYFDHLPELEKNDYYELIENNLWFEHFKTEYTKKLNTKNNWIDFEAEISDVIQELDKLRNHLNETKTEKLYLHNFTKTKIISEVRYPDGNGITQVEKELTKENLDIIKDNLYYDLNRLRRCLELYLTDYINFTIKFEKCDKKNWIKKMIPVRVLNFNYTDTFNRVYKKIKKDEVNSASCYIHGRARSQKVSELNEEADKKIIEKVRAKLKEKNENYTEEELENELKKEKTQKERKEFIKDYKIQTCDLVLGIGEYLESERQNKDNEFIEFKKFYQRAHKQTKNHYTKWLNKKWRKPNTYIFGHSLAPTDEDIIKKLIKGSKKTIIYCRNDNERADRIKNLIQIIGEEEFKERTDTPKKTIIFEPIPKK